MINKIKIMKFLGGLLTVALLLNSVPLVSTAHAAAATISISGITNHSGGSLPAGTFAQVIQSTDGTKGTPGSDGLPAGDTVVATSTINPDGTFAGGASISSSNYIYIRAWETWDGTGNPPDGTYYGDSAPEDVGSGFVYTYTPAGFSTDKQTAASDPTMTGILPTSGEQGQTDLDVTIIGSNTNWDGSEAITFDPDTGITINSVSATNATTLVVNIDIASDSPTTARTVTVSGASGSATFTVTVDGGSDFTVSPTSAYIGQTIVLTGSGFGATPTTITIGGVTANPTAWSDASITVAIPSGATDGNVAIGAQNASFTLSTGGVVIDDVEGGSVGNWPDPALGLAASGYYVYDLGITPDDTNINSEGPQAEAAYNGARGMRIRYSWVSGYGGGWGAQLANTLDISSFDRISFYIQWDGTNNDFKLGLQDSGGHVYVATVSDVTLNSLGGYGEITLPLTSFVEDVDNDSRTPGAINWAQITNYNFTYTSTGSSVNYHNIDSLVAGDVTLGDDDPDDPDDPTGEVIITEINPAAGPAGTQFTASGEGFGAAQGQSIMIFENNATDRSYQLEIVSWSDTSIEAIVPRLATAGNYTLKVIKIAIAAGGTMSAMESNPGSFRVTAITSSSGIATIYPNPFNPLETSIPGSRASGLAGNQASIVYSAAGVQNIGIYIYDSTARLVYHAVTSSVNGVAWNGKNMQGNYVADGVYLLRVVNEESKSLISKGKILVIKKQ